MGDRTKQCPRCLKALHLWPAHPEWKMPAQWGHAYALADVLGKGKRCDYTEDVREESCQQLNS